VSRILVHFSCGAASAVAAKVAVERYGKERDVRVIYCDLSKDEHPDNLRFMGEVERWIGRPVERLKHPKHAGIDDVFAKARYMVGPYGAACTRVLKREIGDAYAQPGDAHVLGYTADEAERIARFIQNNPERRCLWLLADAGITKADCYRVLQAHGIALPAMYQLGYDHNNCIGCVKGGKGYWNKIRRDFPEVFAKRAKQQRELNAAFNSGGELYFLDELGPDEGRDVPEQDIECGLFCSGYGELVQMAVKRLQATPAVMSDGRAE
jgi:hypothetical protein